VIATTCQRWRDRRGTYRPAGEPIRTSAYEVAPIAEDRVARAFVERHHYSGSYPAALARYGLHRRGELVGVAVLSMPQSMAALEATVPLPCPTAAKAELGRLVLLDDVPANGESWFLARAFELAARDGFEGIGSHSDPTPRTDRSGAVIFPGHIGTIYQATNATYVGKSNPHTLRLFEDGSVFTNPTWGKLRLRKRGWRYAMELLLEHGAPEPTGEWRAWVTRAVHAVTRGLRHHGNHRYVWALDKRLRRHLPESLAYPKLGPC
jgi:hypothetical protein